MTTHTDTTDTDATHTNKPGRTQTDTEPSSTGGSGHRHGRSTTGHDASHDTTHDSTPDSTDVDEQFRSLMEGLRTSLPAVQVLFAFLLTAPLQNRFTELSALERVAFATAFYASGLASILLIAPSIHQRVRAPASGLVRRSKRHLIWTTWVAIAGSITMGVAVLATVLLVSSVVFGDQPARVATAMISAVLGWAWFYLPIVTFRKQ